MSPRLMTLITNKRKEKHIPKSRFPLGWNLLDLGLASKARRQEGPMREITFTSLLPAHPTQLQTHLQQQNQSRFPPDEGSS
jgi:hypothetical protein